MYFRIFSASFLITFLSPEIATYYYYYYYYYKSRRFTETFLFPFSVVLAPKTESSRFFRNVDSDLLAYMASHFRSSPY